MAMPDRAGFYEGEVTEIAVTDHKNGANVQVAIALSLKGLKQVDPEDNEAKWFDVSQYDWSITSYQYLFLKNGSPNEITIEQLQAAFPDWNGSDLIALDGYDVEGLRVRLRIVEEEYNGNVGLKVKGLYGLDYEGGAGLKKADPDTLKSLQNRLGSKLRALNPPKPAVGKPLGAPPPAIQRPVAANAAPSAPPAALPPARPAPAPQEAPVDAEGGSEDDLPF